MTKSELRKVYRERRGSLSPQEMADKSQKIADRFFQSFAFGSVKTIHCFIPIAKFNEIDTSRIYRKIWTDFPAVRLAAPRVNLESGETENFCFTPETGLVRNEWGILEPENAESVEAREIDMVLVPLLCFDKRGHRVGYGKGFYDKFLRTCRPDSVKIGLSYFPPAREIADIGSHDIDLDAVVTPETVFYTEMEKGG